MFLGSSRAADQHLECGLSLSCFHILYEFANVCTVVGDKLFLSFVTNTPCVLDNGCRNESNILNLIRDLSIDCIISVSHPWILSNHILEAVNGQAFNLHNGKLPDYGGYNMFTHSILNGENKHTTTIHKMGTDVDRGYITHERSVDITNDDTAVSLFQKVAKEAIDMFYDFCNDMTNDNLSFIPVSGEGHVYNKNDIDKYRQITNINDFDEIDRKTRAFYFPPYEQAYFVSNDKKFYLSPGIV